MFFFYIVQVQRRENIQTSISFSSGGFFNSEFTAQPTKDDVDDHDDDHDDDDGLTVKMVLMIVRLVRVVSFFHVHIKGVLYHSRDIRTSKTI